MRILNKKCNNISLEDMYISKDIEDIKRINPMKMGVQTLIIWILKTLPFMLKVSGQKPLILNLQQVNILS